MPKRITPDSNQFPAAHLVEVAWEVCNQVGGIYTVIRSKAPAVMEHAKGPYCLIGPYINRSINAELEPLDDSEDIFGQAASVLRKKGYDVHYAQWLITGKPRVILLNPNAIEDKALNVVKYLLWKNHGVSTTNHPLINQVVALSYLTKLFIDELVKLLGKKQPLIAHFHEWMAGLPILDIKKEKMPVKTVFTTHATQLGRHLAINSPLFYAHLPFFKWQDEARKFGIESETQIEVACAKHADVLTTVSEVTARECKHLLKRKPDVVLPNGLNIERFEALHEFQNLHVKYKEEIHRFVMAHFFQSYSFDLDKTIYLFTSGRYEYKNKGFDLTLEALHRLNQRLKKEKSDLTVVMFFVTKRDFYSNSDVLNIDLPEVLKTIRYFAECIDKIEGAVTHTDPSALHMIVHEPLGVVGAITPWNYPLLMAVWKIAPILAAGNCVVLKPAEQAPLSCTRLAQLFVDAGGPPGVFNVVNGLGLEAGKALALHPDVVKLSFTGSTAVGKLLLGYAGQSNMKRVALETGGKSPQIFLDDLYDLDAAVDRAVGGIYDNAGQVCNAGSRLLVQRGLHDEFVKRFMARAQVAYRPGDPLDPATTLGPLVSHAHQRNVLNRITRAQNEGAQLAMGGSAVTPVAGGAFVEPTLFLGRHPPDVDHPRRGLRPGHLRHRVRHGRGGDRRWPTIRSTAWRHRSGRAT
jgi:acyl-CoA reductase-like NAD-dependent aldehyde dehydrogenase